MYGSADARARRVRGKRPDVNRLEFLISLGDDPLTGLQIKLDRQHHDLDEKPSCLCNTLESQTIYSFERR